jgi:hypothetical protein
MLDRANLHWIRHQWDLDTDPALEVLAEAWAKLLQEDRLPRSLRSLGY